jgi:hypothetical protein
MRAALVALLLASVCVTACGKFRKNRECTDLAQKVNGFIDDSKDGTTAAYAESPAVVRESRKLAERYRKLSTELGAVRIESTELAPRVEAYRKLADEAATALEGAALALEKQDLELARTRRKDFDRAAKLEPALVKAINDSCAR